MVSNPSTSVKYDRAACTSRHGSTGTATRMTIPSPYLTFGSRSLILGRVLAVGVRFRPVNGENLRTKRPVLGVCPSLPGYGFSDKPAAPGWGIERISDAWCELMARLGYRRVCAPGGGVGARIPPRLGERAPAPGAGLP